jgi:hypothetical protein
MLTKKHDAGHLPEYAAVTNARFARLHGLPVGPVTLSTSPAPPHKSRARHERN